MRILTERKLASTGRRLRSLREELHILDEQRIQFNDDADDMRIRALVSDSPFEGREATDAERHALAMSRRRADIVREIGELEARQDELLDQLGGS